MRHRSSLLPLWSIFSLSLAAAACDPRGSADPEIDALLGFTPSNVDLDSSLFDGVGDVVMDSASGCTIGAVATGRLNCGADRDAYRIHEVVDKNGEEVVLITLNSLEITEGTAVEAGEDRPIVIVALDHITVRGSLTVLPGKNGGAASAGSDGIGEGEGAGVASPISPQNGSGGTHCGRGGSAGDGTAAPDPYGNIFLVPLRGGSSGGGRLPRRRPGRSRPVAGRELRVEGWISAPGEGRSNVDAGGGGGGGILLESQSVVVEGALAANGGGSQRGQVDGEDGQPTAEPAREACRGESARRAVRDPLAPTSMASGGGTRPART